MTQVYFSIILATYNRAHLLPRAIESVLKQSFQDWELLVVDDGSLDHTPSLMKEYCKKDSRIRFISKEHSGLSKTRNKGIEMAQGKYCTFLDSDDEYKADHLQQNFEYLKNDPELKMIHSHFEIIGSPYVPDARDPQKMIHLNDCTHMVSSFIETNFLTEIGGFPIVDFGEDFYLHEKVMATEAKTLKTPHQTYIYYRSEADSLCNQLSRKIES